MLAYLKRRHDPLSSLVLTVPVFLVYHLGLLLVDVRSEVDLVTSLTLSLLRYSTLGYVALTCALALGLVLAGLYLRGRGAVQPRALWPVLGESALYAIVLAISVGWAMRSLPVQVGGAPSGVLGRVVMAAGAGFHEELVFRVVLFAGTAWLLRRGGLRSGYAIVVAALLSSLAFSFVHHLGPLGDPLSLSVFAGRALTGLCLSAIYWLRGFAVAVYTHTAYDALVFFLL